MVEQVVVVGGGIVGLSIAWELLRRGASATVVEKGSFHPAAPTTTGQATWAAAGALAALGDSPDPLRALALDSLRLYPGFLQGVSARSGIDVELECSGMIRLAQDESDRDRVRFLCCRHADEGVRWLNEAEVVRVEPGLAPARREGSFSPTERRVDPRRTATSLCRAILASGGTVKSDSAITGFLRSGDRITGVRLGQVDIECSTIVFACGAWLGQVTGSLGFEVPVRPVRGQVLHVRPPIPLNHVVEIGAAYLVPTGNGEAIVSAVEEDAGFESRVTPTGLRQLCQALEFAGENFSNAEVLGTWSGLRPATPDGLPVIGRVPGLANVVIAGGHFRKGILLAPVTAQLVANLIESNRPIPEAFRLDRFHEQNRTDR